MMGKRATLFFFFIAVFVAIAGRAEDSPYPLYYHDIVVKAAPDRLDRGRIDIFAEVVYDDLQFIKTAEDFEADYEFSAVLLDGNEQIDGKIWKETVIVQTYDETNSRADISLTHAMFENVEPGKYKIKLSYEDLESGQTYSTEDKITVDDFSKPAISGSGIVFARRVEKDGDRVKSIFPEVTTTYKGLGYPAHAFFEIYNPNNYSDAKISYEIRGVNTRVRLRDEFNVHLDSLRTTYALPLPTDSLAHDTYKLKIGVSAEGKKAVLEKRFYIRWAGLPRTAEDLDDAINQLQLIATNKEWKKLKKTPESRKLESFLEFWAKRDPSPMTEQNEAMDAFYAKVSVANQNFTVMGREGWRSDRGMIFILLGPPDEIIRNDYPSDSRPYQVWQYYSINRQFAFYDRNGFGDYEFVNPVSIYDIQRYASLSQ